MRITILGAGYVGLVTGTGLADLGHEVQVVDLDAERVQALEEGRVPIYEPGLSDLIRRNRHAGRLRFASAITAPFDEADAYFICVGTPPLPDGSADLAAVMAAAEGVAAVAKKSALVVVKSTVPVGTCDGVQQVLNQRATATVQEGEGSVPPVLLEAASNPEFLKEGDAVNDFLRPDRVVVGVQSPGAAALFSELYGPLRLSGERPMIVTDVRSSELTKYAANTMLATRISFMNELSRLCHQTGANIHAVRLGVGSDSRIGKKFLYAGPGYGGSCFPKDVQALAALGRECGVRMRVAEAAHLANKEQALFLARLVRAALRGSLKGKHVALWGLAFKPETDDIRESPAVKLAEALLDQGATVCGNDPEAGENFATRFGTRLGVTTSALEALQGAHALVLLTEWRCYRSPNWAEVRKRMLDIDGTEPVVVDARNIWRAADVGAASLRYQGIGTRG